jgi:hypothetical protein
MLILAQHFVRDYHGQTTIHPLGLLMVILMGIAMLSVRREYALWPMILIVCFVPSAQRLIILGADFTLLRLMVLFGTLRVLMRSEWHGLRWNTLDTILLTWGLAGVIFPLLRLGPSILVNRLGMLYDVVGMYFLFRVLVGNWTDVRQVIRGLMWASLPVAAFIFIEWLTRRNVFSVFGGVPEVTLVREGRLRCQGAFAHPILAGCFFAAVLPLVIAQWWQNGVNRSLVIASAAACLFIVFASSSATPLTAVVAGTLGAAVFPLRNRMREIRWILLLSVCMLHLIMSAPVWHLISRVSVVAGGSSWHRYALVDGAIRHLHEWWLIGSNVGSAHWGHFTFDVTNMYIVQGLQGGLPQLGLFLCLIVVSFSYIGRLLRHVNLAKDRPTVLLVWGLGLALWVHVVNHFGVTYFGQIWMGWYLVLAIIASLAPRTSPNVPSASYLNHRDSPSVIVRVPPSNSRLP